MINANELRIGSYLKPLFIDKPFCIVKGIDEEYVYSDCISTDYTGFDEFKPIILTEEILLNNCGMVKSIWSKTRIDFKDNIDGRSQFHIDTLNESFVFRGLGMSIVYVDTLHHLQNLVYAVKQKELEVNL